MIVNVSVNQPKSLRENIIVKFFTIPICNGHIQLFVVSQGQLAHTHACILLSLSRARSFCDTVNRLSLSLSLAFSLSHTLSLFLSLSLSLTHTHTHTYTLPLTLSLSYPFLQDYRSCFPLVIFILHLAVMSLAYGTLSRRRPCPAFLNRCHISFFDR